MQCICIIFKHSFCYMVVVLVIVGFQEAIAKYEVVIQNLEFARELQKQFQSIGNDVSRF